jgi:hypothetical protein
MARSPKHSKTAGGLPFMTIGGAIRRIFSSTTQASAAHDKGRQYLAFYGRVNSPWPERITKAPMIWEMWNTSFLKIQLSILLHIVLLVNCHRIIIVGKI